MYDIAIIGLGPAGATLARLLDKKYKLIAIDRKNEKAGKCCGGLLSPDAQKILAQFNICLPKDVLVNPQIFSVKTIDFDNLILKYYQRFYLNMDRKKFDDFLISLIPENIEIYSDSVCNKIERLHDSYRFIFKAKGIEKTEEARLIIGADGANSIVRKTFYGKQKIDKYISIQEWYRDKTNSPFYSCIFDKKITDSYCWAISKDDYLIIGGAFPPDNSKMRFELLKERVKSTGISLDELVKKEACFVYFNRGFSGTCTGNSGAYLIGEAAGMISPSSLEGISYSMESAKILSEIMNGNCSNIQNKYYFKSLGIRMRLLLKILKMPLMYNKILRKLVMKCGIKAIKTDNAQTPRFT